MLVAPAGAVAQRGDSALIARRHATEAELQRVAVVERKLMIPMRDGVRLATDVYRPRDAAGPVPTVAFTPGGGAAQGDPLAARWSRSRTPSQEGVSGTASTRIRSQPAASRAWSVA